MKADRVPRRVRHSGKFWQGLIRVAAEMPEGVAIKLKLSEHGTYERVRSGLYHAARTLGVGITLTHEDRVVYVERVIYVEKVVHSAKK